MNNLFKVSLLFAGMLCISSSSTHTNSMGAIRTSRFNTPFEISVNEDITLPRDKKELMVRLINLKDSRCPANVQCMLPGNAFAEVKLITKNGSEAIAKLCLGQCDSLLKTSDTVTVSLAKTSYIVILNDINSLISNKAVLSVKRD